MTCKRKVEVKSYDLVTEYFDYPVGRIYDNWPERIGCIVMVFRNCRYDLRTDHGRCKHRIDDRWNFPVNVPWCCSIRWCIRTELRTCNHHRNIHRSPYRHRYWRSHCSWSSGCRYRNADALHAGKEIPSVYSDWIRIIRILKRPGTWYRYRWFCGSIRILQDPAWKSRSPETIPELRCSGTPKKMPDLRMESRGLP